MSATAESAIRVMKPLFQKTLPARLESISALSGPVLLCARQQGIEEDKVIKLDLALEEIMVNIVKYAYPENNETGDIEVVCGLVKSLGRPMFVVEITDAGRPFDATGDVPQPDIQADIDERKIGGLGVFLVKKTMDTVAYRRVKNKNILSVGVFAPVAGNTATGQKIFVNSG